MNFEIDKYYKLTRKERNIFGNYVEATTFFRATSVTHIADESTVKYVGFSKNGIYVAGSTVIKNDDKVIEISPMDFYKAYREYYVTKTVEGIKDSEQKIEYRKQELREALKEAEEEEKSLLADFSGVTVFFQEPSIKEEDVHDGQGTK